ncbi:MAG: hypothetical protein RQ985_03325 [Dehalococcoidia bacterium]|jgi:hypothetical protein|nr:hypothetical protein [Dehalococcoidia bacterium]
MGINNLQDLRDVTIVAFTIAGTVLFLLGILATLVSMWVLLAVRAVVSQMARTIGDHLGPTLRGVQDTVDTVRSTAAFVSETVVRPVAKTYAALAMARALLGFLARRRR